MTITDEIRLRVVPLPPGTPDNPTARRLRVVLIDLINVELRRVGKPAMNDDEFGMIAREDMQTMYHELRMETT